MEVIIVTGKSEEVAAFVLELQKRQLKNKTSDIEKQFVKLEPGLVFGKIR